MSVLIDPPLVKVILDTDNPKLLDQAMYWSLTKEGADYWYKVFQAKNISNEARIKLLRIYQEYKRRG